MGHRLSAIITKTGDHGTTGLGDGTRVDKNHLRIEVVGQLDELNCSTGLLCQQDDLPQELTEPLITIQHHLFDFGAELSTPGYQRLSSDHVEYLEKTAADYNEALPRLKEFILPGGSSAAAICHQARAQCRRVERHLVALHQVQPQTDVSLQYINRLSDWFFILARTILKRQKKPEVLWQNR